MSLLPYPTCSVCRHGVDLNPLYSKLGRKKWEGLSNGRVGVTCPNCKAKLVLYGSRYKVIRFSTFVGMFVVAVLCSRYFHLAHLLPDGLAPALLIGGVFAFITIMDPVFRRFITLTFLKSDESSAIPFPLDSERDEISENEMSETSASRDQMEWVKKNQLASDAGPSWRCTKCEEENAASFEACWNCGHEPSN